MNPTCNSKRLRTHARCLGSRRAPARKRGFLLIMVLLVISTLSLAALNFSDSMLIAREASQLDSKRFQARMMAESGIQAARLFAASPHALRTEMGGSWDNPQKFQALNIVPSTDPTFRGNVTLIAPSLDQSGAIAGIRYGLQNESAKLNLNALIELDKLARAAATAGAAGSAGGSGGGGAGFPGGAQGGFGGGQNNGGQNNRGGQNTGGQGGGPNNGGQGGGNNAGGGGGGGGGGNSGGQVQQQGGGGGGGGAGGQNQGGQNQGGGGGGGGGGGNNGGGGGGFGGNSGGGGGGNGNNNGNNNGGGNRGGGFGGGFGGGGFGGAGGASGGQAGGLSALAAAAGQDLAAKMLMALPGMTQDVADAILDFIDADDEPRPYGAEYADYYQQMQPPYKPANGPLTSIEQLLLVRGVTPQLLFGYDQNRNGVIDASEQSQMLMGAPAGAMPGSMPLPTASSSGSGTQPSMPGPLGWAPYLTLHSQEKNVGSDGTPRININGSDLQALYDQLVPAVGDQWASYIIAYRIGGQKPAGAASPLQALLTAAASTVTEDGMMGAQLSAMGGNGGMGQPGGSQLGAMGGYGAGGQSGNQQGGQQQGGQQQGGQQQGGQQQGRQQQGGQQGGQQQGGQQKQPWNPAAIQSLDLSQQQGSVQFTQILDLVDSSVTIGGQGGGGQGGNQGGQQRGGQPGQGGTAYSSPISSSPIALAEALPVLMDKLTTVDAEAIPGRINIMECPRELLAGIPGMTTEIVDSILQARSDGAQTDNRRFETWLAAEGLVTIDQMRAFMPLMTCGGDVFKAQVIGYYEGSAPFCRAEAIISGVGATPKILFYRRLDHLGRGFDVATLGQRLDVGAVPTTVQR